MYFSIIIPVFNRPDEIDELLESILNQTYTNEFEVVIIEDGSEITCETIIKKYTENLSISYFVKNNSGPGDSRNYGMKRAKGDYFIILDSDCVLPNHYLKTIDQYLSISIVDFFGGPDAAKDDFSVIQKAINFSMTSFLTTGGIRGGGEKIGAFQPRSFNMGISKKAFESSGGFDYIHPGEDPDLVFRLWEKGFKSALINEAYVYHKRRISWSKFFNQVNKFGKVRPILNKRYPNYSKFSFWLPTLFIIGIDISFLLLLFGLHFFILIIAIYLLLIFIWSTYSNKSIKIGSYTIIAVLIQFYGYGLGFLQSTFQVKWLNKDPEKVFPELFYKK